VSTCTIEPTSDEALRRLEKTLQRVAFGAGHGGFEFKQQLAGHALARELVTTFPAARFSGAECYRR
jgi:hypothetical protein